MKALAVAALVFGMAVVALAPLGAALYRQVYPADPARTRALASCRRADPGFDRLDGAARAACYRRFLGLPLGLPGAAPSRRPGADWQAMAG